MHICKYSSLPGEVRFPNIGRQKAHATLVPGPSSVLCKSQKVRYLLNIFAGDWVQRPCRRPLERPWYLGQNVVTAASQCLCWPSLSYSLAARLRLFQTYTLNVHMRPSFIHFKALSPTQIPSFLYLLSLPLCVDSTSILITFSPEESLSLLVWKPLSATKTANAQATNPRLLT